jgi:hypothetical protein
MNVRALRDERPTASGACALQVRTEVRAIFAASLTQKDSSMKLVACPFHLSRYRAGRMKLSEWARSAWRWA